MPVVDAVLVVAMVCLSGFGALRLPPEARIPVHFGPWSEQTSVPKAPGLVMWVAVGVVTYLAGGVLTRPHTTDVTARLGLTLALGTILVTQAVAVGLAVIRHLRA